MLPVGLASVLLLLKNLQSTLLQTSFQKEHIFHNTNLLPMMTLQIFLIISLAENLHVSLVG